MTINKINTEKLHAKKVFYALCKYAVENPISYAFNIYSPTKLVLNSGENYELIYENISMTYSTQSRRSSSLSVVGTVKSAASSDETEDRSSGQSTEIEKHTTIDSDEFMVEKGKIDAKRSSGESTETEEPIKFARAIDAKKFTLEDAEKLFKANSSKEFRTVVIQNHNVSLFISMLHFDKELDVQSFDIAYGAGAAVKAILAQYPDLNESDLEFKKPEVQKTVAKKPGILNSFMQNLQCCSSPINQTDIAPERPNATSPVNKSYKVIKSVPHVQKKHTMGR